MGWLIGLGSLVVLAIALAAGRDEMRAFRSTKGGDKMMLPGRGSRSSQQTKDVRDKKHDAGH